MLKQQAIAMLNTASQTVESLSIKMDQAAMFPEYLVVIALKGVGTSLGPQLIAEIGDVTSPPQVCLPSFPLLTDKVRVIPINMSRKVYVLQ